MTTSNPSPLFLSVSDGLGAAYALERELGGGGMSHVFLAEERSLGRRVVVKVLMPELAAGVSADRFAREVRLAAQLQQANIVPVLSAGEVVGLPYYTMPFVGGQSLRVLLDQTPKLPIGQVVAIASDVAKALAYAHAHGVVHRDIKPENILLSGGTAVVTDFGIAKAISESRTLAPFETMTQVGTSLGTPAYMAPEQAMGDPSTDHRADLYALGVVMYEMVAGDRPFRTAGVHDLVRAHLTQVPEPVRARRPDVPKGLADLIMRCLEKSPGDRPASADAMLAELAELVTGSRAAPAAATSRRRALIGGGVLALAAVVSGVMYLRARASDAEAMDVARVLVVPPTIASSDESIRAVSMQATDAVERTLESLPSIRHSETAPGPLSDAAAIRKARGLAARTIVMIEAARLGRDSARFRFRLVDGKTSESIRTIRPVDVAVAAGDSALRGALEPVFSTLAIASEPNLGPVAIPLGDAPRFAAVRELVAGMEVGDADSAKRVIAVSHYARAIELDRNYLQARLWSAVFLQQHFSLYYSAAARLVGDTVIAELGSQMDRLSPLERSLYDFVVATHRSRVPEAIEVLRRLREIAPETPLVAILPEMLLNQNRPIEALAVIRAMPPLRDPNGKFIPARDDPDRWRLIAEIDHYLGDRKGEQEAVGALQRLVPDDIGTARLAVVAATWSGDSTSVRSLLDHARSLPRRPGTVDFFGDIALQTGQELEAHGHPELGKTVVREAIEWFATHPEFSSVFRLRWALAYADIDELDRARQTLDPLLQKDSTSSLYVGLAGRLAARRGDTVEAGQRVRQLERLHSQLAPGADKQERAFIAADLGQKAEAVALLQEAFADGLGWGIWHRLHWFSDVRGLHGYEPFEKLLKPLG